MTTASGSKRVVVDSSAWIEFLADGPKAAQLSRFFEREEQLLVPTIVIYEVYKKLLREQGATSAERFFSQALRLATVQLDAEMAAVAAQTSLRHGLAMADAIVYAAARAHEAQLVTMDKHFRPLPGVSYF